MPIGAVADTLVEGPETLQIELLATPGIYTLGSTGICGDAAATTAAITINDPAAPVPAAGLLSGLIALALAGLGAVGLRRRKA